MLFPLSPTPTLTHLLKLFHCMQIHNTANSAFSVRFSSTPHVMHPATGMLLPSALRAFVYGTDVAAVHESLTVRLTVVMVAALAALLAATGRGASLLSRVRRVMLWVELSNLLVNEWHEIHSGQSFFMRAIDELPTTAATTAVTHGRRRCRYTYTLTHVPQPPSWSPPPPPLVPPPLPVPPPQPPPPPPAAAAAAAATTAAATTSTTTSTARQTADMLIGISFVCLFFFLSFSVTLFLLSHLFYKRYKLDQSLNFVPAAKVRLSDLTCETECVLCDVIPLSSVLIDWLISWLTTCTLDGVLLNWQAGWTYDYA
jgi:hypothetical protein